MATVFAMRANIPEVPAPRVRHNSPAARHVLAAAGAASAGAMQGVPTTKDRHAQHPQNRRRLLLRRRGRRADRHRGRRRGAVVRVARRRPEPLGRRGLVAGGLRRSSSPPHDAAPGLLSARVRQPLALAAFAMLRLSLIFLLLLLSTATRTDEESVELAWLAGDARQKAVLESAERDWYHYRRLTDTNVRTILRGDECPGADQDQRRTHARG